MNTSRSWLLVEARRASVLLAVTAGLLIAASGAGWLSAQDWWAAVGLTGGAASLALFGLFFGPWWLLGAAISTTLVVVAFRDMTGV